MPRNFAPRLRMIVHAPEIIAAGHWRERAVEGKDLQTVPRQIEFANDFGAEQGNDVRANGKFEAGKHLFRYRCAAEYVTALEHQHTLAGTREICGVNQPVVAAADNYDVVFAHCLQGPGPRV